MEDLDIYLYIVLFVIYALSRVFKGVKKSAPKSPSQGGQSPVNTGSAPTPPKRKPFSFEDILREFETASKGESPPPDYEEERPVAMERPAPPPIPVPEVKSRPSKYKTYEGTSLETLENVPVEEVQYQRNSKYSLGKSNTSKYLEMLKKPGGAKNAIILGEIINRKYF